MIRGRVEERGNLIPFIVSPNQVPAQDTAMGNR